MHPASLVTSVSVVLAAVLLPAQEPTAPSGGGIVPAAGQAPDALVSLTSRISHPLVFAGEAQEVYLHLGLRAAERPAAPRLGMNLALVIDRSGSMASEDKLRFAKSAAEQLVSRLRPDDRLAIVAYDDQIRTVVPSTPAGEKDGFFSAIRALEPGNSTDLCGGLMRGYEEVLTHLDVARLNGVLLVSDGLANAGVKEPAEIAKRAAECRTRGVRISTMGMGLDYDEDLLCGVAQNAGGNYYYVDQAEAVGRYLDQELDELGRVIARDLEVRVELGEGVELRQLFGFVHRVEGRTVIVPLRDMVSGQGGKVVLRLGVACAAGKSAPLAAASLRYVEAVTREPHESVSAPLEVRGSDDGEAVQRARDLDVLVQAEIVQNAIALDGAMELQKAGQFQAAQELLAARYLNSKTVNDTEYKSAEVARILRRILQVMQDLERTRADVHARRDLQLETQLRALGYASQ